MARDPYRYFRVEARELLDQLGKVVLELDKGGHSAERVALLLRLAHTLKGAARVVKQREIAEHAHAIEDAFAPLREDGKAASRECIEAALAALDQITQRLATLGAATESGEAAAGSRAPLEAPTRIENEPLEAVGNNVDEMDVLLGALNQASVRLAGLRQSGTPLERSRRLAKRLQEQIAALRGDRALEMSRKLPTLISELRALIEEVARDLNDGLEQADRDILEAREAGERLRLLPASFMFLSLERTMRDAAHGSNKRVAFAASGGDVRLDAQVFGGVQSALVQAVRNAVAHGIEPASEREAAGKPTAARIAIDVRRRGHRVLFVCTDDGRGVDLEAVKRALERKGLLSVDVARLGTDQLLKALLAGGISTSGVVTQLAGRGVGLDVIRETVGRLRGEVGIRTERGVGTALEISVPVSLAAVEALIVDTGGQTVGIPLESVKRTLRIAADDLIHSPEGTSIVFDGEVIPFGPMERALRRATHVRGVRSAWSALVIQGANALAAVGIERIRGMQNLVMRPLPALTPCDPIAAGASLDAEGHPQLVLDPDALVEQIHRSGPAAPSAPPIRAPILVVDDSLTTRMLEQSILESAGYEVDLATSAEAALEKARKRTYALFLVDVEMPGMDGFSFIERLREDPLLRDIPAILVTSRASPEDRERGRNVGAQGYIVKGEFDQTELLGKIRDLVSAQ
jgi:two-component system chemotaxis sensor kinase CheA